MLRSLSMTLLCAASLAAGCGRTPLGPEGGAQQTCDPSCAEVCAATIDRCGSLTKLACETQCRSFPTSPVTLCLRQLTCDSPAASCDQVWRCQTNPQVPDLTIRSYTADSPTARKLRWRVEVCNVGSGPSLPTQLALYLQRNGAPGVGDLGDARLPLQGLSPQQCASLEHTADGLATDRYRTWAQVDPQNAIVELREDNNHGGPQPVDVQGIASDLPELRVNLLRGYIDGSNVLHYEVEVCNAGKQSAYQVRLELYYNRATAPTTSSMANRSRRISALLGGTCTTLNITGYSPYGAATVSSWAYVDRRDEVQESDESNNIRGPVTVGKGTGKPDLMVSQASAKVSGSEVSYSAQVCNHGNEPSAATTLALFYDPGNPPKPTLTPNMIRSVPELPAGKCSPMVFSTVLAKGSYASGFYVDPQDKVAESNESNNAYYPVVFTVGGGGKLPDLMIKAFTATGTPGRVDYHLQVCNVGATTAPPTLLDLFHDLPHQPGPYDKPSLTLPVSPLDPGKCFPVKTGTPLTAGKYSAWAHVNRLGAIAEASTKNNIAGPRPFTIAGSQPDLYVKDAKITPSGTTVSYVVTVCNQGVLTSGYTELELFHQTSKPTAASKAVTSIPVSYVSSGSCRTLTTSLTLGGGSYSAWFWINRYNKPVENNTSNNLYGPRFFYVSGTVNQPDLRIASFQAAVGSGGNVTYLFTICNDGQSGAASVNLALFYNPSLPPQPGDQPSYSTSVPYMPPGYCSQRSAKAFLQPGSYTSYAYIDFTQKVIEKNETNNTAATSYIVGTQGADLVLKSLSATPGSQGSTSYEIKVCNEGVVNAPTTEVHLFYNQSAAPTQADVPKADKTVTLVPLTSKSCSTIKLSGAPKPGFNTSWAAVDLLDKVAEVSNANNAKSVVVIVPSSATNLLVKDFDAKPSLTGPTLYSVKVCNGGTTPTPATTVRFYFDRPSAPPVGTPGDQSHNVSPLLGGACVTVTGFVNHPAGSYTSWALVDPTDALQETSETDNVAGPLSVTIGGSTTPCEDACKQLVSPCGLLPASQEKGCVTNCKSLPQSKIDCAGAAAQAGKCADIVTCLFT